jgi:Lrp/AsnC family leucine-responsive transcriptional regulator
MNLVKPTKLDDTDWAILDALQEDGRMSVAALARAVNLSPTATTERLNRLRDTGVISAVRAAVDPTVLGFGLTAFIRMRTFSGTRKAFITALTKVSAHVSEGSPPVFASCCVYDVLASAFGSDVVVMERAPAAFTVSVKSFNFW